jgi:hypothetical protein
MIEVIGNKENKTHLAFWNRVVAVPEGRQNKWNQVFQKY